MNKKKKILFCSYLFPPIGGPRSLRWLNLIQTLKQKQWDVHVLTINPSSYDSFYDQSLMNKLPEGVRVFRSYAGPYYSFLHARKISVRGFSKTTLEWLPFGLHKGYQLIRENEYFLIISSALPFVGHLIAFYLKKRSGLPWVADYGDPLGFNPLTSAVKRFIGTHIERHILNTANGIIVPFEEMKKEFLNVYPSLKESRIKAIGQGIPEGIERIQAESFGDMFVICYVGSFYSDVHEPYQFFQALHKICKNHQMAQNLKVIIAGNTEQKYIQYARQIGIDNHVQFLGQVPFEKAVSILKGSSVILYIGGKRDDYHFPSKVLVSAASKRPILAVQQSVKDLGADFIKKNRLGYVVPNDPKKIEEVISNLYQIWDKKKIQKPFHQMSISNLYWKERGEELEMFLMSVLKEKRA